MEHQTAVHIEISQSLDNESCLAAVTWLIEQHGYPITIINDNCTDFFEAANRLKVLMEEWDKAGVESESAQNKIVQKFNAPGAPQFGWILERLFQNFLSAEIDNQILIADVPKTTINVFFEQILNARPVAAFSDNPEYLTALTTNHFLLGREKASAPFMANCERYKYLINSFKTAEAYADMSWKWWHRNYLPQWKHRSK